MSVISQIATTTDLSNSEQAISSYILEHKWETLLLSAGELSKLVYCSQATLVRFCKKIGFKGFNDLKAALAKELMSKLDACEGINWNFPFKETDSADKIAASLATLSNESIAETMQILDYDLIEKAADMIDQCSHVYMFGISQNHILAMNFQYKMMRIGKPVIICNASGDDCMWAYNIHKDECAILLSYSGETFLISTVAHILNERNVPTIGITSMGNNTVSSLCSYHLEVASYEDHFSKIAGFASEMSFQFILNLLFSCVFKKNYAENYAHKYKRDDAILRITDRQRNTK